MSNYVTPPVTVVTSTEALQSGLGTSTTPKKITDAQKSRLIKFIKAHENTNAQTIAQQNANAALAKPQISAEEQSAAIALKGGNTEEYRKKFKTKTEQVYGAVFTNEEGFLELDLQDFQDSLLNKRKSLVDLTNWSEPQKALRKYLLTSILIENKSSDPALLPELQTLQKKVLESHKEYIQGSVSAAEVGMLKGLSPLKLKDFVRTYQTLEKPQAESKTPELIQLFKALRKAIESGRSTVEMVNMCNNLYAVLKREKSQYPNKATSTRQYLILSKIAQLQTLTITQSRHSDFLDNCKRAKLYALPSLAELMNTCLQITVGGDTIIGVNNLMKMASAIGTQTPGLQDMFVPHYNRFVLQSEPLAKLYKTNFHQKQVGEHISKSIRSTAVLAEGTNALKKTA